MNPIIHKLEVARDNPPAFDNIAHGDNAPDLVRHAIYGWVKGLNRAIAEIESITEVGEDGLPPSPRDEGSD